MPKKPPRNAFFFFMLDYKARLEQNGERFPNGLRDVQEVAGEEWKVMQPSERKYYDDLAKEEKKKQKGDSSQKQTCWHNTFQNNDMKKRDEEEQKTKMNDYIKTTIQSLPSKKLLAEYPFYLIHVNYYCISEGECYHPAEIAIAEFTLGSGVTNVFHAIIDCGMIPLGYKHDAMEKSKSTHRIPVEDNGGEKDFYKICKAVQRFLQPGIDANNGEYPPMYTMEDNVVLNTSMSAVQSFMKNLADSTYPETDRIDENCEIYPLDKLFHELENACLGMAGELQVPITTIRIELEKDVFSYTQNIACDFHYNEDVVQFCSKSYVQRWVYLICDHCCQNLGITMVPGQHVPLRTDMDRPKQVAEEKQRQSFQKPHVDSRNKAGASSNWVPVEQPPIPRPQGKVDISPYIPWREEAIDHSEESFPAMPVNNGRGRGMIPRGAYSRGGGGRGGAAPLSFASIARSKK